MRESRLSGSLAMLRRFANCHVWGIRSLAVWLWLCPSSVLAFLATRAQMRCLMSWALGGRKSATSDIGAMAGRGERLHQLKPGSSRGRTTTRGLKY